MKGACLINKPYIHSLLRSHCLGMLDGLRPDVTNTALTLNLQLQYPKKASYSSNLSSDPEDDVLQGPQ